MSETIPSGNIEAVSDQTEATVKRAAYEKVLGEKKSMQSRLAEKEALLEQISNEKLEAEGKWKELAESNKKLADNFKEKNLQIVKEITNKTIKSQFKSMSERLGCIDPDLAYSACNFDDIEVTNDFEFEPLKLEEKIQSLTKSKPHLFKKDFKLPQNLTPSNTSAPTQSLSGLTETELKQLLQNAK